MMFTTEHIRNPDKKLDSLIFLRGLAVLLVCINHFLSLLYPNLNLTLNILGRYGVHIFFVVSGFVIPLSLYKGNYIIRDYGRFLYKRFLRLQLPYVMSVCFTYLVILLSVVVRGVQTSETGLSFIQTLFYTHVPDMNGVYWTLLVEIQYYFFIGLLFPLLISRPAIALPLFLSLPLLCYFFFGLADEHSVNFLAQSPFFFIGITGFLLYSGIGNRILNLAAVTGLLCIVLCVSPFADFISSLFALLFILCYTFSVPGWLQFLGTISYSVYLIHFPLGYNFLGFVMTRTGEAYKPWIIILPLMLVFIAGYIFYRLFEVPSEAWSAKVKYKKGHYQLHEPVAGQSADAIEQAAIQ